MSKPSEGAMRAARRLRILNQELAAMTPEHLQTHANIIDTETGLPELVEALHHIYAFLPWILSEAIISDSSMEIIKERRKRIGDLLARAEGREG